MAGRSIRTVVVTGAVLAMLGRGPSTHPVTLTTMATETSLGAGTTGSNCPAGSVQQTPWKQYSWQQPRGTFAVRVTYSCNTDSAKRAINIQVKLLSGSIVLDSSWSNNQIDQAYVNQAGTAIPKDVATVPQMTITAVGSVHSFPYQENALSTGWAGSTLVVGASPAFDQTWVQY